MSRLPLHLCCVLLLLALPSFGAEKPNIVFVITDDQGYGDLACHGNPVIKTPHIDKLYGESSSLSDYHVAPTCSPTRASLLTGHWTNRTGAWHTIMGRSMLREDEVTIGQLLKDNGYTTGMFGKWHLGDNFPYRPEDRGFTEVYRHGGGGVGQTPDVWDNSYFDGGYFHNGKIVPAKGFCTDVFFEQANSFIRKCAGEKKPFFAYISTNAPHGPFHCPQKYLDLYKDQNARLAAFFGMITNIDENVGKTRALLKELGVSDNTIFIFTTDNGTAGGAKVFNAGMRGQKGSPYDGGHRVPFILHWPAAGMNKKHIDDTLAHAVDIVPTLLDMTGSKNVPAGVKFDGLSLSGHFDPSVKGEAMDRMLITDSQRVRDPIKWKSSSVMSERWRLLNGKELYDIQADPGQKKDVAAKHPEQVAKMRAFYEAWWKELEPTFARTTELHLGHPGHPEVSLTSHDWIQGAHTPWNQGHIRRGTASKNGQHDGHWAVKVLTGGSYTFSLRRWPAEANKPINAPLPAGAGVPGASPAFRVTPGKGMSFTKASLRINGKEVATAPIKGKEASIEFTAKLTKGSHQLSPIFIDEKGKQVGAYYLIVTKNSK